jgi:hypothetical protein
VGTEQYGVVAVAQKEEHRAKDRRKRELFVGHELTKREGRVGKKHPGNRSISGEYAAVPPTTTSNCGFRAT